MEGRMRYPVLEVDLEAVRQNAEVMCRLLRERGIDVAGVIKFSDGDLEVARAYSEGGCKQIASSRTIHLERIKKAMPQVQTMLIRIPYDRGGRGCRALVRSQPELGGERPQAA